jgi:signal transduction histidine kinase
VQGPDQRGWRILALSLLFTLISNWVLASSSPRLTQLIPVEIVYFAFQILIAVLQVWAVLSWPFRPTGQQSQLALNVLGSLVFGSSLLLLFWISVLLQARTQGHWPIYFRLLGWSIRVALLGGVVTYILAEDPRRVRGPMGWIFMGSVAVGASIVLIPTFAYDQNAVLQASPVLALALGPPLAYVCAAWLGDTVEVAEDQPRVRYLGMEGLLYVPFMAVGLVLIFEGSRTQAHLLTPLICFIIVSALIVSRQFLLLLEVRRAKEKVEEKVLARTRSLEELQDIMLRTERLNSIGTLGAGLAHDLNNALATVKAYAELARSKVEDGKVPATLDLDRILAATNRSAALTGRLMAYARLEDEAHSTLDLAEEISNHETILRMLLTNRNTLTLDLESQPVRICISRHQLEQILVNLLVNARDAMPQGGNITLKLRTEPEVAPPSARLEISDTGEGMTLEVLASIFQPFFTTKPQGKGTGIGLSLVKQLVETAEGSIQVDSTVGGGTRFTLRFPILP